MKIYLVIVLICLLTACASEQNDYQVSEQKPAIYPNPITGREYLQYSEDEIINLTDKAKSGDMDASFLLAKHYELIKKDNDKSLYWLEKTAKLEHPVAQQNLALLLATSNKSYDHKRAIYWYEISARAGNSFAQVQLADIYDEGKITKRNINKALYWYEKAALQKELSAGFNLIDYYSDKTSEIYDIELALAWIDILLEIVNSGSGLESDLKSKRKILLKNSDVIDNDKYMKNVAKIKNLMK